MNRRIFLRNTGLTGAIALTAPSLFSSSVLGRQAGAARAVLVVLSGGVRRQDFAEVWNRRGSQHPVQSFRLHKLFSLQDEMSHASGHRALYENLGITSNAHCYWPDSPFAGKIRSGLRHSATEKNFSSAVPDITSGNSLAVVHLEGFDCAHYDLPQYYRLLENSVEYCGNLWKQMEKEGNGNFLAVTTDMGRNSFCNEMGGTDHHDESARDIFCLTAGRYTGTFFSGAPLTQEFTGKVIRGHLSA